MYDVNQIRKDFPMLRGHSTVFMDNCATTLKPDCVIEAVNHYFTDISANAHRGDYEASFEMDRELEAARDAVARFLNVDQSRELVFTSGTTGGLNLVAYGYGRKHLKKGDVILTTRAEHASCILPWMRVAEETGARLEYIPLDDEGRIRISDVEAAMDHHVKVIATAHITNVLGYAAPIREICRIAHEYGAVVVVDGAQSVPHLPVDIKNLDCDFLAFSAHKMCGPSGIGVLYGKMDLLKAMDPLLLGGASNANYDKEGNIQLKQPPYKFESGTLPLEGICGLHAAVRYLSQTGMDEIHKHERRLHDRIVRELLKMDHIQVYNPHSDTGIITFNVKNVFAQDVAALFNKNKIEVRTGQHCSKLMEDRLGACSTIRASIYLYTSDEDADRFIEMCAQATKENCLKLFYG